jgi:hypothetical protein
VSALEIWLQLTEPGFKPTWQHVSTQTYFLLGRSCGVGERPEIYFLSPLLDDVVPQLSDERIGALVAVLRHGSREEQKQMIQGISDEVFKPAHQTQ